MIPVFSKDVYAHFNENRPSSNYDGLLYSRAPEVTFVKTTRVADDAGVGENGEMMFLRGAAGKVDASSGYKLDDLKSDRPYLEKKSQAKSESLSIPGNTGGSRLDARSVTAVLKSLDGISLSNRPPEVKGVIDSIKAALLAINEGKPIPGGQKGLFSRGSGLAIPQFFGQENCHTPRNKG